MQTRFARCWLRTARSRNGSIASTGTAGLPRTSVVNVTQVATVDKSSLMELIGELDDDMLKTLARGLRQSLSP